MMAAIGPCCRRIVFQQELVEGSFFSQVIIRLGIECLHLIELFRRQLWEMANEMNQLPTVLVLRWVPLSPSRHRGEANAVMNDPEYFSV